MDKLDFYRQIIRNFLQEQAKIIPLGGIVEPETIISLQREVCN